MFKKFLLIIILVFPIFVESGEKNVSLDMQNINIQDALHIVAKFIDLNVAISPSITGTTSLHFHDIPAQTAFDLLVASNNLIKWQEGKTWFVTLRTDFIQNKQEQLKLKKILEETEPLITHIWQIHYAKADDIAHLIQDNNNSLLSKRGHVRVDVRTNIVCVQDVEENIAEVRHLIKYLDIPIKQVLIKARLANIDNDFERELGINFSVDAAALSNRYSLAVAKLADCSLLDVQLSALEKEGHGELISSPSLFTANQQMASIEAGEEIPYQEISNSGATGVAFKKAVLSLKVTPQIMPDDQVLLQLQVNQDKPNDRVVLGVPAISTRQISTNVLVRNGQTIVLGGVYETNKEDNQQRIPFLGKIPWVGLLFRQQNVTESKRELLIFVTPQIIPQNRRESKGKNEEGEIG